MATFTNLQTTEAGQALLAEVHAGIEQLTITAIAFGSGIWTDEEYAARTLTALKNEVLRVVPSGGEQAGGVADITCVLTNAALETGFALTELAVITKKADNTEVLYMVDSVEAAKSTWISPASEHLMQIPVELRIACSSTSQINIRIESTAPVTTADMDRHNNAADAHPDIRQELKDHTHDEEYYMQGEVNSKLAGLVVKPIGLIELMPFRPDALPTNHYMCNGEGLLKISGAGKRLLSLSATFKSDWGITDNSTHVFLPNAFSGSDGYFFRPVNGSNRRVGNKQSDAIRNIVGTFIGAYGSACTSGVFKSEYFNASFISGNTYFEKKTFDASRVVSTASENRPKNIGMTPTIYLPPM